MKKQYTIIIKKSAEKSLHRISQPRILEAVLERIASLAVDPRPADCKELKTKKEPILYRISVGDYRIVYIIRDSELVILVIRVGHRKDVYRDLKSIL